MNKLVWENCKILPSQFNKHWLMQTPASAGDRVSWPLGRVVGTLCGITRTRRLVCPEAVAQHWMLEAARRGALHSARGIYSVFINCQSGSCGISHFKSQATYIAMNAMVITWKRARKEKKIFYWESLRRYEKLIDFVERGTHLKDVGKPSCELKGCSSVPISWMSGKEQYVPGWRRILSRTATFSNGRSSRHFNENNTWHLISSWSRGSNPQMDGCPSVPNVFAIQSFHLPFYFLLCSKRSVGLGLSVEVNEEEMGGKSGRQGLRGSVPRRPPENDIQKWMRKKAREKPAAFSSWAYDICIWNWVGFVSVLLLRPSGRRLEWHAGNQASHSTFPELFIFSLNIPSPST